MILAAALAAAPLAAPLSAQEPHGAPEDSALPPSSELPASRYLSTDDPAYRYIDLLVDRGVLTGLNPMVRPYRRMEVARAVLAARRRAEAERSGASRGAGGTTRPGSAGREGDDDEAEGRPPRGPETAWLERLAAELAPEVAQLRSMTGATEGGARSAAPAGAEDGRVAGELRAGSWGVSHPHRDLLRPTGEAAVYPFVELEGALTFESVVAHLDYRVDGWLVNDPQFPDGNVAEEHPNFLGGFDYAGRAEDAYVALQIPHAELLMGRLYRNWGLSGTRGLLVSDYPYSYDQVGYRIGGGSLRLTGFVAPLDTDSTNVKRWASAHRLDWRPSPRLALAVTEEVVYGGEDRSFDFAFSNPVNIWIAGAFGNAWNNPNTRANNLTELAAWWRPTEGLVTYLALMIDRLPSSSTPFKHGLQASVRLPALTPRLSLRLGYTQVATLAYQTRPGLEFERVAFRANGLGRDLADYDRLSLEALWLPTADLAVRPAVSLQRRGEEDFRDAVPSWWSDGPVLFSGEVETTLRLSVAGEWRLSRGARVAWDVGPNLVWDARHVPGRTETEGVGRVRLEVSTGGTSGL